MISKKVNDIVDVVLNRSGKDFQYYKEITNSKNQNALEFAVFYNSVDGCQILLKNNFNYKLNEALQLSKSQNSQQISSILEEYIKTTQQKQDTHDGNTKTDNSLDQEPKNILTNNTEVKTESPSHNYAHAEEKVDANNENIDEIDQIPVMNLDDESSVQGINITPIHNDNSANTQQKQEKIKNNDIENQEENEQNQKNTANKEPQNQSTTATAQNNLDGSLSNLMVNEEILKSDFQWNSSSVEPIEAISKQTDEEKFEEAVLHCKGQEPLNSLIISHPDFVSRQFSTGELPLVAAVRSKNMKALELLVEHGSDVFAAFEQIKDEEENKKWFKERNVIKKYLTDKLEESIIANDRPKVVDILRINSQLICEKRENFDTFYHLICSKGNTKLLNDIKDYIADEQKTIQDTCPTPVMVCLQYGFIKTAIFLDEDNWQLFSPEEEKFIPLLRALRGGDEDAIKAQYANYRKFLNGEVLADGQPKKQEEIIDEVRDVVSNVLNPKPPKSEEIHNENHEEKIEEKSVEEEEEIHEEKAETNEKKEDANVVEEIVEDVKDIIPKAKEDVKESDNKEKEDEKNNEELQKQKEEEEKKKKELDEAQKRKIEQENRIREEMRVKRQKELEIQKRKQNIESIKKAVETDQVNLISSIEEKDILAVYEFGTAFELAVSKNAKSKVVEYLLQNYAVQLLKSAILRSKQDALKVTRMFAFNEIKREWDYDFAEKAIKVDESLCNYTDAYGRNLLSVALTDYNNEKVNKVLHLLVIGKCNIKNTLNKIQNQNIRQRAFLNIVTIAIDEDNTNILADLNISSSFMINNDTVISIATKTKKPNILRYYQNDELIGLYLIESCKTDDAEFIEHAFEHELQKKNCDRAFLASLESKSFNTSMMLIKYTPNVIDFSRQVYASGNLDLMQTINKHVPSLADIISHDKHEYLKFIPLSTIVRDNVMSKCAGKAPKCAEYLLNQYTTELVKNDSIARKYSALLIIRDFDIDFIRKVITAYPGLSSFKVDGHSLIYHAIHHRQYKAAKLLLPPTDMTDIDLLCLDIHSPIHSQFVKWLISSGTAAQVERAAELNPSIFIATRIKDKDGLFFPLEYAEKCHSTTIDIIRAACSTHAKMKKESSVDSASAARSRSPSKLSHSRASLSPPRRSPSKLSSSRLSPSKQTYSPTKISQPQNSSSRLSGVRQSPSKSLSSRYLL